MSKTASVRVRLCASDGFYSHAIEYFGGLAFSHMANFLADGRIIDAQLTACGGQPAGVRIRPGNYLDSVPRWIDVEIPCEPSQAADWERLLRSQEGKDYDRIGIADFIDGSYRDRNWRSQKAWFCSELSVWALESAGICPHLTAPAYKIAPGAGALIVMSLGGKIVDSHGYIRKSSGVLVPA
jgi:hypothetical protein